MRGERSARVGAVARIRAARVEQEDAQSECYFAHLLILTLSAPLQAFATSVTVRACMTKQTTPFKTTE